MKVIYASGDRTSDLYYWRQQQKKVAHAVKVFDAQNDRELQSFFSLLSSLSLFNDSPPLAVHNLTLDEKTLTAMTQYDGDVFIITLQEKFDPKKIPPTITLKAQKIGETQLKEELHSALRTAGVSFDRTTLAKLYDHVSVEDSFGKKSLSPSLVDIFLRRLAALQGTDAKSASESLTELLLMTKESVSQWDLIKKLFSSDKQGQYRYFSKLLQQSNLFEMLGIAKTTLFLLLTILKEKEQHLDTTSIATKTKKNVYYIESLLRTAQEAKVTPQKAFTVVSRLMNLELAIKSGKFDDEQFAFDILLATL